MFPPANGQLTGLVRRQPYQVHVKRLVGEKKALFLKETSLKLYNEAFDYCFDRGIILADTKFEFSDIEGRITLADEIFTPDSMQTA